MRWQEPESDFIPPSIAISLLRKAIEKHTYNPTLHARLGAAFERCSRFSDALSEYEVAARQAPNDFQAWPKLARCYLELDCPEAALEACRRGEAYGSSADIQYERGCALHKLRRLVDAQQAFLSAIKSSDTHLDALQALLGPMARDPDGRKLLDFCEALPRSYKDTALARAHRAIALSRIGQTKEALQIVDLQRYVARIPFVPPSQFGGIDQFNHQLADDILADRSPSKPRREGFDINYAPRSRRSQSFLALRDFMKSAINNFLGEASDRGFDAVMPPPPTEGTLYGASLVLRDEGHNGEHLHAAGYISVVYHVLVPDSVIKASDDRGALALGCCENYTGGYAPCWGTRYMKPVAGSLVIFPSHIYHDVVPSRTHMPRISVTADLPYSNTTEPSGTPL
jgi:tetratricopeptide (TPR) repeat protein